MKSILLIIIVLLFISITKTQDTTTANSSGSKNSNGMIIKQTNYNFVDTECTGEANVITYWSSGACIFSNVMTCQEDGRIIVDGHLNENCNDTVILNYVVQNNVCDTNSSIPYKFECIDSYDPIPTSDSFLSFTTPEGDDDCGNKDLIVKFDITPLNICISTSQELSYIQTCNQTTHTSTLYYGQSCKGNPLRINVENTPDCETVFGYSTFYSCLN